uniref:Si:dkey-184p18.2 n=1 Tax=Sinocyclocheilus grahami TaxID=75366 RepID=A0A672SD87_SINGR
GICHAKNLHYISLSIPASALPVSMICPFCFQWRQLGNHHVRLRPKRKPTATIRRLLKRESAGKRLSAEQTVVLQKFKRASNALVRSRPPVLCPLQFKCRLFTDLVRSAHS